QSITATAGQAFNATVALFTAADASTSASNFRTYILWGDGSTTVGSVTGTGSGHFAVTGQHTYAQGGTDTISVIILYSTTKAAVTVTSTAQVAGAPLSVSPATVNATEGKPFTGVVASFTGGTSSSTAGDFSATISWGGGHTSPGVVKPDGAGGFR